MYQEHWKLTRRPFENRIEEPFYYPAETHQAALLKVRYAIENRRAAALLCGASGLGKTLIADALAQQLDDWCRPVQQIVFPAMSSEQFVRYVVNHFDGGAESDVHGTSGDLARFERFLRENLKSERHAVIIVDEAHLLEQYELLEPLRLMLNIAASAGPGEAAWTLVLVGQPTLLSHVERYHALDERLAVKCMLNRLLPDETVAYVQHRLRVAGADAESIFDYPALERIHMLTQGVPRRINRLCDLALMVGYAEDKTKLTTDVMESVHHDLAAPAVV